MFINTQILSGKIHANFNKGLIVFTHILLVTLLSFRCVAQTEQTLQPILKDTTESWERFSQGTKVSGNTKVGAVSLEANQKISPTKFYVRLPEHSFNFLEVDISSRDGKYDSKLVYDIRNRKGKCGLELPTRYREELSGYTTADLTILAKISNRDKTENFFYVLSSWHANGLDSKDFVVHLLSNVQTYLQFKLDGAVEKFGCEAIEGPSSRAYNTKCTVHLKSEGTFALEIIQRIPKKPAGYRYFPIRFPFKY